MISLATMSKGLFGEQRGQNLFKSSPVQHSLVDANIAQHFHCPIFHLKGMSNLLLFIFCLLYAPH